MKRIRIRLSYILAALLLIGSLFLTPYYTTRANEPDASAAMQEDATQDAATQDAAAQEAATQEAVTQDAVTQDAATQEAAAQEAAEDDHSTFSNEMIQAAINRYKKPMLRNAPIDDDTERDPAKIIDEASLPYTGEGSVLALHISFPNDTADPVNQAHPAEDNEEALRSAVDYLHDYYERASYGKLNITGDVISYNAQKARGDYMETEELLSEALHALDETVDFTKYDADDDQQIDCVYMHIPYNSADGWGNTWWPNCSVDYWKSIEVDGVTVGSYVVLSRNVGEENGVVTLVHETGHAMGFPDYYSYDKEATDNPAYPGLTGTLTFDMMDNNTGDHNGFSKWIAGWLDEDDVTRVFVSDDEVYAVRGGQEIGTRNDDGSITLDLYSFDTNEIEQTGGIIVVGSDVSTPFSNYYMLQYDTFAGNQQVYYKQDPLTKLTSGFRVFRVQAELTNGVLNHSNTYDVLFNKLVELVDHDYTESHYRSGYPYAPVSDYDKEPYGCMFYKGDILTPLSDPSTNFRENIDVGFTGIYMEFLESNDTYGTVKIWYSEEEKPETVPFDIQLESAEAVPGGFFLSFKATQLLALDSPYGIYGVVDNMGSFMYYIRDLEISGNTLTGKLYLDTDILKKGSTLEVRFGEGAFTTADGEWSPKITVEIPVSPDLVELTESGFILDTEKIDSDWGDLGIHKFTPVLRAEDGTYYFYDFSNTYAITNSSILYKYSFTDDAPTDLKTELIDVGTDEFNEIMEWNHTLLRGEPTENAAIVPESAQLGEYSDVWDAIQIDDYYYVLSYKKENVGAGNQENPGQGETLYNAATTYQLALSKLDADGSLIKQVAPVGDDIVQDPTSYSEPNVMIQQGPNNKLAILLYKASQTYMENHLTNHAGTFFYDLDLVLEGRLDNFSTGCGTWLDDGRYIAFTSRTDNSIESNNMGIDRTALINYDITGVIDPDVIDPEIEYTAESESGEDVPTWESDSDDGLLIHVHRNIDDDSAKEHFRGVKVDDKPLTEGTDYTVEFASVHITLLPAFLQTLSAGTHTMTVEFDDGSAAISFELSEATPEPDSEPDSDPETEPDAEPDIKPDTEPDSQPDVTPDSKPAPAPSTGDASQPILWIIIMAVALVIVAVIVVLLIRKRK